MSRLLKASLKLHDEDSWRLPDWEEYSESGQSAWTDEPRNSDNESDASDDDVSISLPLTPSRRAAISATTTLTASKPRMLPLPIADLKALHMRFAQERQRAADKNKNDTKQQNENENENETTQTEIASQLQSVREQLREFQHQWQTHAEAAPRVSATQTTTMMPVASTTNTARSSSTTDLRFDMAVQTDLAFEDDALRQWLHLITQKMDVVAASFHHDTTQLPLTYPLQSHLETPVHFHHDSKAPGKEPLASWHVGGSLKALVSELSAERLLDLERSVACLATATHATTTRYVEYFEKIIMQIQELHQQRLRQVVDESLQEMKAQRNKYKKRVELLELERRTAKEHAAQWQQKATSTQQSSEMDREKLAQLSSSQLDQWGREREQLLAELTQLRVEISQTGETKASAEATASGLRQQLDHVTRLLQAAEQQSHGSAAAVAAANEQLCQQERNSREMIERLESAQNEVRAQLQRTQHEATQRQEELQREHHEALETTRRELSGELRAAAAQHRQQLDAVTKSYETQVQELRLTLEQLEHETTERSLPLVDQHVQTDDFGDDNELLDPDDHATTDARVTRLTKRCRALENLLDKKFEESSVASVDSRDERWRETQSHHSYPHDRSDDTMASRTLPLSWSFQSSQDETIASSHAAAATPTREDVDTNSGDSGQYSSKWETSSNQSARSNASRGSSSRSSVAELVKRRSDPEAPSAEAMLALVRKLEAFATTNQPQASSSSLPSPLSRRQPDEEPGGDLSDATSGTPTAGRTPSSAMKTKHARATTTTPTVRAKAAAARQPLTKRGVGSSAATQPATQPLGRPPSRR